jgi:hypothetical protein
MRVGSTVILSVFPLDIAIKQIEPHLRSAVSHFTTSINYVVFQRGSRSMSRIVDVDLLKTWVQFVVKARNEDYPDALLNIVFIKWIQMNP